MAKASPYLEKNPEVIPNYFKYIADRLDDPRLNKQAAKSLGELCTYNQ
jgi:hypothetical protein